MDQNTNLENVSEEVDNMGYALPITQVKYICKNIWNNGGQSNKGVVKRAMLGVMVTNAKSWAELKDGHLEIHEEFVVYQAAAAGAAAYNKLLENDVFKYISINGGEKTYFTREYQLNDLLLTVCKGDRVTIGFERDGSPMETTIKYDKDAYFTIYG